MDKRTVEFMCQVRAAADIVNALTHDLSENDIGQDMKTALVEMLNVSATCLCWMRDNKKIAKMNFQTVKENTTFDAVLKMAVSNDIPRDMRKPLIRYLRELPGFKDDIVDTEGFINKSAEDLAQIDMTVPKSQHEYVRSLFVKQAEAIGL